MTDMLSHVHITDEAVATFELTPPHDKRVETPAYKKAHDYLINKQDRPCGVCGVRKSTLGDPTQNLLGSTQLESHHYPIERSLVDACDPDKVHKSFPQVIDRATLLAFVDSPANLIVLCDICHRSKERGIHHLLTQDFAVQPYLYDGYSVVASAQDKAALEQADDAIMKKQGEEV